MRHNYAYSRKGERDHKVKSEKRMNTHRLHRPDRNGMKQLLRSTKPTVILFLAPWDGVGTIMEEVLRRVEQDYHQTVRFAVIDVEENQEAGSILNINRLPTVAFIKEGEIVKLLSGAVNGKTVRQVLDRMV